jgi:hypothetical protein
VCGSFIPSREACDTTVSTDFDFAGLVEHVDDCTLYCTVSMYNSTQASFTLRGIRHSAYFLAGWRAESCGFTGTASVVLLLDDVPLSAIHIYIVCHMVVADVAHFLYVTIGTIR